MHVPRTMFAATIDRFGGPEVITPHALPVPAVDAGEVLLRSIPQALMRSWLSPAETGWNAA
jgi:hypothetical protein